VANTDREAIVALERLTVRREFLAVAKGRRIHSAAFTLQTLLAAGRSGSAPRFGLTVTKKVGTAAERNRIRRRLRAILRRTGPLAGRPGHDYVIVAKRECLSIDHATLSRELERALAASDSRGERTGSRPRRTELSAPASEPATTPAETPQQAHRR
jgi:ribonuclease P protein component